MIERPFKQGADFEALRRVILRETTAGPVPIIELGADASVMAEVAGMEIPADQGGDFVSNYIRHNAMAFDLGKLAPAQLSDFRSLVPELLAEEVEASLKLIDVSLAFHAVAGYDYVTVYPIVPMLRTRTLQAENPQQGRVRVWQEEHRGLITDRREFEAYPWPSTDQINLLPIDYVAAKMPAGMKVMVSYLGIFDDLKLLMGFEPMAIKSIEEPELLGDILERLTVLAEAAVDQCAAHPAVGAVFYGEDMGFKTGTMLNPRFMREWVIPRHQRIAAACHRHGKPFIFHSCGRIEALMEDLIEVVKIDAKHSFQDNIEPIEEAYRKYHDRIALLGGVDVDLLARGTPGQVRGRTRQILEACGPGGGIAIGSGNSVTNYCRIENYYAMLDETRAWNEEHGWR